ncbi:MAG TPA: PBP1A family penicillin-binding protein [Kiloniellales bacterium]|nr:PBP1A family penicillin-binding protein [Kiloniellales bacterium]
MIWQPRSAKPGRTGRRTGKRGPSKGGSGKGGGPRRKAEFRRLTTAGRPAPPRRGRRKGAKRPWLRRLVVWGGSATIWAAVFFAGLLGWYAYDLPEVGAIDRIERQASVTVMAADGTLISSYGDVYGETVSLRDLPPHLPRAVLAVEDRRFYDHFGIDLIGLGRAMMANLRAGEIVQGGSTITQQLAKNLFLSPERTIKRKIQEMMLALWLERKFTKDQILSLYLNRVYLGAGTYGVDAAARHYFGKPASAVNLYEAALLAGLLKAPSRYNPVRAEALAERRTALVLDAMVDAGFITGAQAEAAARGKTRGRAIAGSQALYFADWVRAQIESYIGPNSGDLVVITTLNPYQQRVAEEELASLLAAEGKERDVSQGAIVLMSPDGAIRAMVGGRSYDASQFNRATQALRQPGSAFKAFVYLAGLEQGLTPDTRIPDAPITVEGWSPQNYDERYHGTVTLREAFARSLNSVAVRVSERAGRTAVANAARRLGITSELEAEPSIALGTSEVTLLELTGAFATFANHGKGVWPYGIEEIRRKDGTLLYRRAGGGPGRVIASRVVERMTDLMRATVEWGSGKAAKPDRPAAGKTGTSQDFRDAWFVGYTAGLVGGVWLGNDDGAPMNRVSGGTLPARLWRSVLVRALEGIAPRPLPGGGPAVAEAVPGAAPGAATAESDDGFIARILKSLAAALPGEAADDSGHRTR